MKEKTKFRRISQNQFADDESYFSLDSSDTANNRFYYRKKDPEDSGLDGFSCCDHYSVYITPSGNLVTAVMYDSVIYS